jgi:nicotinate-nucleotide adenylyltransferase
VTESSLAPTLGILGGTFNPPHRGHLEVARYALRKLGLGRVVLIPAALAPHKPSGLDPGPEHRLAMCELAVEGGLGLSVCAAEVCRGGTSYTIDTLRDIHASHPDAQLTFIVGADTARTLGSWREPRALLELAGLALAKRQGQDSQALLEIVHGLHPDARVEMLDMPEIELSSSMVRERVSHGEPIDELVEPAVAAYIDAHGLYRQAATVSER